VTVRAAYASNGTEPGRRVHFWCPGCDQAHGIVFGTPTGWTFNEDLERPTIQPSVLVGGVQWGAESRFYKSSHGVAPGQPITCHSFVTDGQIQYLGDCTHALAGQIFELPPWPYGDSP
jgi:hypothetical protein